MFEKVLNTPLEGILKLLDRLIHTLQSQVYLDHTYLNLLIPKVFKKKNKKKKKETETFAFLFTYSSFSFTLILGLQVFIYEI